MMSDIQAIEKVALTYSTLLLVVLGLFSLSVGMILWLGGSIFHRAIGFVFGIIIGVIAAWVLMPDRFWAWLLLPIVAGAIGTGLSRIALAMIGVILVGGTGYLLVAFYGAHPWSLANEPAFTVAADQPRMGLEETMNRLEQQRQVIAVKWREMLSNRTISDFTAPAIVALLYIVGSLIFRRAAGALAASGMGAVMVGFGMMCLLLQKGSTPLSIVLGRLEMFGLIFAGMIVFGTVIQFVLCPRKKKRPSPTPMEDKEP